MATSGTIILVERREYNIDLTINGQPIKKVIIDRHYEEKHSASVDDQIILELVKQLDGQLFVPDDVDPPYAYFVTNDMILNDKRYKLVWLLEEGALYVGVVNAYRRK